MLVAGVDEQFGPGGPGHGDQFASGIEVALACEELVAGLAVDLNGQVVGPDHPTFPVSDN